MRSAPSSQDGKTSLGSSLSLPRMSCYFPEAYLSDSLETEHLESTTGVQTCRGLEKQFSLDTLRRKGHGRATNGEWPGAAEKYLMGLSWDPTCTELTTCFRSSLEHVRRSRPYFTPTWEFKSFDIESRAMRYRLPQLRTPPALTTRVQERQIVDDFEDMFRLMKIDDLLPEGVEARHHECYELKRSLRSHYGPIRQIHRYYSKIDVRVTRISSTSREKDKQEDLFTMSRREFAVFCNDCRLVNSSLTPVHLNIIYLLANRSNESTGRASNDGNSVNALVLYEFMATLVRCAARRYAKSKGLGNQVALLLENDVIPHAHRDDPTHLRSLISNTTFQAFMSKFLPAIEAVFSKYALADKDLLRNKNQVKASTVSIREFVQLVQDFGLVDEDLTIKEIQDVFVQSQKDPVMGDEITFVDESDSLEEMVLPEFVEALCRIGLEKFPPVLDIQTEGNEDRRVELLIESATKLLDMLRIKPIGARASSAKKILTSTKTGTKANSKGNNKTGANASGKPQLPEMRPVQTISDVMKVLISTGAFGRAPASALRVMTMMPDKEITMLELEELLDKQ